MSPFFIVLIAFIVMEPVAALAHRLVMHGFGWAWHRSHHRPHQSTFDRNDLYPLSFSIVTFLVFLLATIVGIETPIWIGAGVALYGLSYAIVHDVVIHQRLGKVPDVVKRFPYVRWVRNAHRVHHLYARAPYGFLLPMTPAQLRERARNDRRDPIGQLSKRAATANALVRAGREARTENTS